MNPPLRAPFWRLFVLATVVAAAGAVLQTFQQTTGLGVDVWRSRWLVLLGVLGANLIGGIGLLVGRGMPGWLERVLHPRLASGLGPVLGVVLLVLGFAFVWFVRLIAFSDVLPRFFPFLWIFLWLTLMQAAALRLLRPMSMPAAYFGLLLAQGVIFQVYGHIASVSAFPFSIGYSEAGRHYYASLFFAESIYGEGVPLPFLHPSRYLLMSAPFLFDGLPLWAHRLWQGLLWIGLTAVSAWLLARRLRLGRDSAAALFIAWAFLFFLQGAVYYHLQVAVILVLAFVSPRRPWRTLLAVVAASAWAGISRVNWFPIPALLAALLHVIEVPFDRRGIRYLAMPAVWFVAGIASALLAQAAYVRLSGQVDTQRFASSFTSSLLWNRLLPNTTFPIGILPGILILSAPALLAIWQSLRGQLRAIHSFRLATMVLGLLVLFAGGLVVSVKIGGGADLHNMDGYLIALALIAAYLFAGRLAPEPGATLQGGRVGWDVLLAAALVPTAVALGYVHAPFRSDATLARQDVQALGAAVASLAPDGEVLFVTERQLLTFGELDGIALVPEYEQMELMEMAMSGNRAYLEQFYADLAAHRFAVVIAEDQKFTIQKRGAFIDENTAWVRYVGAPLLCAYRPVESLASANVQVFVPRPSRPACRDPFVD